MAGDAGLQLIPADASEFITINVDQFLKKESGKAFLKKLVADGFLGQPLDDTERITVLSGVESLLAAMFGDTPKPTKPGVTPKPKRSEFLCMVVTSRQPIQPDAIQKVILPTATKVVYQPCQNLSRLRRNGGTPFSAGQSQLSDRQPRRRASDRHQGDAGEQRQRRCGTGSGRQA